MNAGIGLTGIDDDKDQGQTQTQTQTQTERLRLRPSSIVIRNFVKTKDGVKVPTEISENFWIVLIFIWI